MNNARLIAKNATSIGISQIISSIVTFFIGIYIARELNYIDYGKYNFAISFTAFFIIIADLGISNLIIKDIAQDDKKIASYITNVSIIKIFLSIIGFISIVIIVNIMGYSNEARLTIYLFGVYTILTSYSQTYISIIQAIEKMEYSAFVVIVQKILFAILVLIIFALGYRLLGLAIIYIIIGIVGLAISLIMLKMIIDKQDISKRDYSFNLKLSKSLISSSLPFALNSLFGVIFFNVGILVLSILKGDSSVGIYSAAYNPLLAVTGIITTMTTTSLYPAMSKYFISDKKSLENLLYFSFKYMLIIGMPMGIGCYILADRFIFLLYAGDYMNSIVSFQILAFFIPLRLASGITGTLLTSINRQSIRTSCVGLSGLLNIALNILLDPKYNYIGASLATVSSEILLYVLYSFYVNKYTVKICTFKHLLKPLVSSIIMGLIIIYTSNIQPNILISVLIYALIYFIILISLKEFSEEDYNLIKAIFKRKGAALGN